MTAVDFMENFVEKNKEENSHLGNAAFIQADVTKLEFPEKRLEWELSCGKTSDVFSRIFMN